MAMNNWFECKVKYEKTLETGTQKKVAESYLVDAMSFTEAENRITEEMTPFIVGEFEIAAVKKARISELFIDPEGDKWYRAKVMFITLDEKSGIEKKTASTILVQASDFQRAVKNLEDGMKGTMSDWEINTISETTLMDVFGMEVRSKEPSAPTE